MMLLCRILVIAAVICCVATTRDSSAGVGAIGLVSPAKPDNLASTVTFRSVQTSTEVDNPSLDQATGNTPHWLRIGLESRIGSSVKVYDIPVVAELNQNWQVQFDVPFVSVATDSYPVNMSDSGLGDVVLSLKYRAIVDDLFESYYIFSAKLPSGAEETGLGSGSADFSFTHKTIVLFGDYRTTFMAGVTIPPPTTVTVSGSSVEYSPTVSCMAATERNLTHTGLRFGVKVAALHTFNSKVNGGRQLNAVTTVDVIPEVAYRFSEKTQFKAGITIPALTVYDLPGADNTRGLTADVGVQWFF